jgi:hypothetical protein
MTFPYKKVLLVGATSGIGRALAASLVEHGCFVIAVGRRQDLLDSFVQEHGADKAASFNLDISKLDTIPDFVKSVTSSHPDLDCVFVNSGIQRRSIFSEPESIDMNQIQDEMTVNDPFNLYWYIPFLHLIDCVSRSTMFLTLRWQRSSYLFSWLKGTLRHPSYSLHPISRWFPFFAAPTTALPRPLCIIGSSA